MAKQRNVSIYEVVGNTGKTGAYVGQGCLVGTRYVLFERKLSDAIASEDGPTSFRVGICSDKGKDCRVEVIDDWEESWVRGKSKSGVSLVVLEQRRVATSPTGEMEDLAEALTEDELVEQAARTWEAELTARPKSTPARDVLCRLLPFLKRCQK